MKLRRSDIAPRGAYPFKFRKGLTEQEAKYLHGIPGVYPKARESRVSCTFDIAPKVSQLLGREPVEAPRRGDPKTFRQGLDYFRQLGFHEKLRLYQKQAILQALPLDFYYWALDMRLGKTFTSLACATLRGATRFVCIVPGFVKPVWRREILKFFGEEPLVLDGRSGDRGYFYKQGQTRRTWIRGKAEIHAALREFNFVIVNYDILQAQVGRDAAGKVHLRQDMMGWSAMLRQHSWDCAIIDEGHLARGWKAGKSGFTRGDLIHMITCDPKRIPLCYILSGTPMPGKVADYWQQMRIMGGSRGRRDIYGGKPFDFHVRYCNGGKTEKFYLTGDGESRRIEVWEWEGISRATEFASRVKMWQVALKRRDVSDDMPRISRELREVELAVGRKRFPKPPKTGSRKTKETKAAASTIRIKGPVAVEEALQSAEAGNKVGVYVRYRESYEYMRKLIRKEAAKKTKKLGNFKFWNFCGEQNHDQRHGMAEAFVDHPGGAILLATMEALPGGISLRGLTENHFVEIMTKADTILQVEARGAEMGERGIISYFYAVPETYDDRLIQLLIPNLEQMEAISGDIDAVELRDKLQKDLDIAAEDALNFFGNMVVGAIDSDIESDANI